MYNNLNAIFRPQKEVPEVKPIETTQVKLEKPRRRERADRKKDIKFPVDERQHEELRRRAKELKVKNRDPNRKYETISNTDILLKALDQCSVFPERFPPLIYSDTKKYMHAEPMLRDYERIEELALKWNLSLRKTVYRLIMNYIFRGEVDSVAYRKGQ